MKITRHDTFETNSSSVHTVCIKHTENISGSFQLDENGNAIIRLFEFGWSGCCETPTQKIAYLALMIWHTSNRYDHPKGASTWCVDDENQIKSATDYIRSFGEFKHVEDVLRQYTGIKGIVFSTDYEGYIDHQSTEDYKNLDDFLKSNEIKTDFDLYNFIIGESYIEIGNDND